MAKYFLRKDKNWKNHLISYDGRYIVGSLTILYLTIKTGPKTGNKLLQHTKTNNSLFTRQKLRLT